MAAGDGLMGKGGTRGNGPQSEKRVHEVTTGHQSSIIAVLQGVEEPPHGITPHQASLLPAPGPKPVVG